jgi:EAL domain-containing protein (putative c-di-GMP-specific phosphodiesterase class I)/DNA-binding response OmpR family regulator
MAAALARPGPTETRMPRGDRVGDEASAGTATRATVLVADDDTAVRETIVLALRHAGYHTIAAADGDEALTRLGTERVDVALLDVDMPGRTGFELLRTIRSDPRHEAVNVILVTGDAALDSKLEGFEAGAHDYLVKPVALEELRARVAAQLRDRSVWLSRLDERLAARTRLARRLAEVDTELPHHAMERELRDVLGTELRIRALTVTASHQDDSAADTLSVDAVDGGLRVRQQLRFGGTRIGLLEATVDEDAETTLSTLGDLAPQLGAVVAGALRRDDGAPEVAAWVREVVEGDGLTAVFQPIVSLADGTVVGFEGLSRFADGTRPDQGFARAVEHGLGRRLETAAIETILRQAAALPAHGWISVNVSGGTLLAPELDGLVTASRRPVVLELTENERVVDYARVRERLASLPATRLAVDDAGAGYASLRHIFELRPDLIKLDRSWISELDADPARQALIGGLAGFARVVGAEIVAEGIEHAEELLTLQGLGVSLGQGYLLDRPAPAGPDLGAHARAVVVEALAPRAGTAGHR